MNSPTTCGSIRSRARPRSKPITCKKSLAALSAIRGKPNFRNAQRPHQQPAEAIRHCLQQPHAGWSPAPLHRGPNGTDALLSLPFHYAIDDAQFYTFGWLGSDNPAQRMSDPDRVLEMWWAAFLQQYGKGGYPERLRPPYVSGRALRSKCSISHPPHQDDAGLWVSTCEEKQRIA